MLKQTVSIDEVIALLNDAFEKDPEAIHELVTTRVPCNEAMADHPTIQVGVNWKGTSKYVVGVIGILNGIFGTADDGYGAIAGDFDVICPNGHEVPDEATARDNCATCGENLRVGKLVGFRRIR